MESPEIQAFVGLIVLGLAIGVYGTLIGAGGGFVLMPLLLVIYRDEPPETLAAVSLAVVFFNAASGSLAYARMKRIDYRSGLLFAAAGAPGAVLGAFCTEIIPRLLFDVFFGLLMFGAAMFLFFSDAPREIPPAQAPGGPSAPLVPPYNRKLGMGISFFVGYLSSLLGVGGGILHVPIMARVLKFPVHVATATSHFVLAALALTGSIVHLCAGHLAGEKGRIAPLAVGVVLGAQDGALISDHVHGKWILRGLALALAFVGARILLTALR